MSAFVSGVPGEVIEKIMSLSLAEFALSLARLAPETAAGPGGDGGGDSGAVRYSLELAAGRVDIDAAVMAPAVLGGLIRMPRCRVVIRFTDAPEWHRREFLRRFDQAFQRGGG